MAENRIGKLKDLRKRLEAGGGFVEAPLYRRRRMRQPLGHVGGGDRLSADLLVAALAGVRVQHAVVLEGLGLHGPGRQMLPDRPGRRGISR
jgi:hypothetical protein